MILRVKQAVLQWNKRGIHGILKTKIRKRNTGGDDCARFLSWTKYCSVLSPGLGKQAVRCGGGGMPPLSRHDAAAVMV